MGLHAQRKGRLKTKSFLNLMFGGVENVQNTIIINCVSKGIFQYFEQIPIVIQVGTETCVAQ